MLCNTLAKGEIKSWDQHESNESKWPSEFHVFFSPSGCLFFFLFLFFSLFLLLSLLLLSFGITILIAIIMSNGYEISYGINGSGDIIWMVGRLEFQRPMGGQQLIYRTRSGDGHPQSSTDLSSSCRLYISLPTLYQAFNMTGGTTQE